LVAFTSEIFKGAVFQSLDGIIVSANCKLRKIFTLKSKPQDTADKDGMFCYQDLKIFWYVLKLAAPLG
jgi:hypothetical protein